MSDPISHYLEQIARYPLLTKQQEIMLARQVHTWLHDPAATPKQQKVGKRAYEKLINCNLRLVVSVAKRYTVRSKRSDMLDLIQEGNIGLMHGIKKFDPERGYALSTYIYWWVRQGITRYLSTGDRIIRLPSGGVELLNKLRYWLPGFFAETGRMPTVEECAEYCSTTPGRMRDYMLHLQDCHSADAYLSAGKGGGDMTLLDTFADERPGPVDSLEWSLGVESLDYLLDTLSETDQEFIRKNYGLDGAPPITMSEIAKGAGLSRERVRQRISKSLVKLRLMSAGVKVREVAA